MLHCAGAIARQSSSPERHLRAGGLPLLSSHRSRPNPPVAFGPAKNSGSNFRRPGPAGAFLHVIRHIRAATIGAGGTSKIDRIGGGKVKKDLLPFASRSKKRKKSSARALPTLPEGRHE